jgi:hypothetical protein
MQRIFSKGEYFFSNGKNGLAAAKGGPWTPAAITTALWLDATDSSTITESSGSVTEWSNKSGTANSFTPPSGVTGPVLTTNAINGNSALDFLTGRGLGGVRPYTSSGTIFYIQKVASDTTYLWLSDTGGPYGIVAGSGDSGTGVSASFGTISLRVNGAAASSGTRAQVYTSLGTNAVLVTISGVDFSSWSSGVRLGNYDATFRPDNGLFGEWIAVSGSIFTSDRDKIEGYLAHKWGLTASLPNDHPYKTVAPTL